MRDIAGRTFLVLHVLGAIASLGPTLTYGLWIRAAERADPAIRAFVLRSISWLDRRLPTPAYMAQAVTGIGLIWLRGWSFFRTSWLVAGAGIYVALMVAAIVGYAPSFRRQRALAERLAVGEPVEAEYRRAATTAARLGVAVTALTLTVVVLMVAKPTLW